MRIPEAGSLDSTGEELIGGEILSEDVRVIVLVGVIEGVLKSPEDAELRPVEDRNDQDLAVDDEIPDMDIDRGDVESGGVLLSSDGVGGVIETD